MNRTNMFFVPFVSLLMLTESIHAVSFKSICSFFGGTPYEETIHKDYIITPNGSITITNLHGSVIVETGIDKRTFSIKAVKRASKPEHLQHMHIVEEKVSPNTVSLHTTYDYEKVKGAVQYRLTVPEHAQLNITVDAGDIEIKDAQGACNVSTGNGDIIVYNAKKPLKATITQQGNITAIRPQSPVYLTTNKGTVRVIDSNHTVDASAKQGKVEVKCRTLPKKEHIKLFTQDGPITLHTTDSINARIHASTEQGTVNSTQKIMIAPMETTLDKNFWQSVKQSVHGTVGIPEAEIDISSENGTIHIMHY